MTGRVRHMIVNPEETGRLPAAIAEGSYYGMRTFDQALLEHVQAGRVSMEDALCAATRTTSSCSWPPTDSARHRSTTS